MASVGYPDLARRREEHRGFIASLKEIEGAWREHARESQILIGLVDRLCTYLRRHIGETDRKMARALRGSPAGARLSRADLKENP